MCVCVWYAAYQQPVQYNLSVAREVLKHVYTAERLQPPTSFGAVLGTYGTLWGRARSIAYWRKIVTSGEWARLGVYAVEAYGIFKVSPPRFVVFFIEPPLLMAGTRRLGRLLGVGRLLGITCSKTRARSAGLHAPVRRTGSFHREHWHNNRFNLSLSRIGRCIEIVKLRYLLLRIPFLFLNFLPCAKEGSIRPAGYNNAGGTHSPRSRYMSE